MCYHTWLVYPHSLQLSATSRVHGGYPAEALQHHHGSCSQRACMMQQNIISFPKTSFHTPHVKKQRSRDTI